MSDPKKPYEPPVPPMGLVKWSTNPGATEWFPAIVTARSGGSASVLVIPEEAKGGMPKDAVLHASDPRFLQLMDQSSGVWDYTDETKLLHILTRHIFGDASGKVAPLSKEDVAFANRVVK